MVITYRGGGANDKSFISRLLGKRRQLFKVFGSWKKWLFRKSFNYYQTENDKQMNTPADFFSLFENCINYILSFLFYFCFCNYL